MAEWLETQSTFSPVALKIGRNWDFCTVLAVREASIKRWDSNQTSVCGILEHICSGKVTAAVKQTCCRSPGCLKRIGQLLEKNRSVCSFSQSSGTSRRPSRRLCWQRGAAGVTRRRGHARGSVHSVHPGVQGLASDSPAASMRRNLDLLFFLACNILKYSEFWNLGKLTCDSTGNLQRMVVNREFSLLCHTKSNFISVLYSIANKLVQLRSHQVQEIFPESQCVLSHSRGKTDSTKGKLLIKRISCSLRTLWNLQLEKASQPQITVLLWIGTTLLIHEALLMKKVKLIIVLGTYH